MPQEAGTAALVLRRKLLQTSRTLHPKLPRNLAASALVTRLVLLQVAVGVLLREQLRAEEAHTQEGTQ